jgi:hypothetical protein
MRHHLTDEDVRAFMSAHPDKADDCARALRGCKSTRNEIAHLLGKEVAIRPLADLWSPNARTVDGRQVRPWK